MALVVYQAALALSNDDSIKSSWLTGSTLYSEPDELNLKRAFKALFQAIHSGEVTRTVILPYTLFGQKFVFI